ncbi:hypothetical protein [Rufibacter sp. XAAS-G3-1]|uniref:hypothetical protein n=1 Tax=Rufibacter sp. XAAS-G3-1 TaxID=2729134 RepID=UPI0015E7B16D|nr:hypothetical protein [Rufibacter sp. XAAS-G3-1]
MDASEEFSQPIISRHIELEKIAWLLYTKEITEEKGLAQLLQLMQDWQEGYVPTTVSILCENQGQAATLFNYIKNELTPQLTKKGPDESKNYFEFPNTVRPNSIAMSFLCSREPEKPDLLWDGEKD